MPDLFGNPDPLSTAKGVPAVAVTLFEAAAEGIAYETGRNVAQVRTELVHGRALSEPWYSDVLGAHVPSGASVYQCQKCGATFVTHRANATTCNLCRKRS